MMDFALKTIPLKDVEQSFAAAKQRGKRQTDYNTAFHTHEEISAALPELQHNPPDPVQPWILLRPWLDLIQSSQGLPSHSMHEIELPQTVLSLLARVLPVALITGRLPPSDVEDLHATFPTTTTLGVPLRTLFHDTRVFPRLDTCSLKDAVLGHVGPVKDIPDLWTRLASSARGGAGIRALSAQDPQAPVRLYLFPWNARMDPELEYRVFCAPPDGRISAVSQYKWHDRWRHGGECISAHNEVVRRVWLGVKDVHARIMAHPSMAEELPRTGFSFDVYEDLNGCLGVGLIELNGFGALSGCGSCLFHWIRDAEVLYGVGGGVEFRVGV